ncbi:hypothetical protein P4114_07315 [Pseudomonas aeruginosa]|nr:hypothetical protein [Pseudomonas aeruginosa]MDF5976735.1 hypothetical protein [Pseudomonas aeruginosa]MDF5977994.1 hypothetical protein [Pseudomonas aeruginosa]
MSEVTPGVNIKRIDARYLCAYSMAEELFRIVGNVLCVKRYGEMLLSRSLESMGLSPLVAELNAELGRYIEHVDALDQLFSKRVRTALLLDQANSNVVSLRQVDVDVAIAPPLTLVERRRRTFESDAEVYAFLAGMCGVGLHTTGAVHLVDVRASRKPIENWWAQLLTAQALCARLRLFAFAHSAETRHGAQLMNDINALELELSQAARAYRSRTGRYG